MGYVAAGILAWTALDVVPFVQAGDTAWAANVVELAQNERGNAADQKASGRVDCRAAAEKAVEDTGGQLLSVRLSGGQCVITILVPGSGDNGRPRKMTVQVGR
ncbi:hypothetical protein [Allorhizobium sonneratiae]|uniref:hypothetical protein n=1 Tax=Allorhizobium sonneratiae TaxID=2934936 RepID=UPI0020348956|nr:hypothetical protein [Allorhizobium sonneratiae]